MSASNFHRNNTNDIAVGLSTFRGVDIHCDPTLFSRGAYADWRTSYILHIRSFNTLLALDRVLFGVTEITVDSMVRGVLRDVPCRAINDADDREIVKVYLGEDRKVRLLETCRSFGV